MKEHELFRELLICYDRGRGCEGEDEWHVADTNNNCIEGALIEEGKEKTDKVWDEIRTKRSEPNSPFAI